MKNYLPFFIGIILSFGACKNEPVELIEDPLDKELEATLNQISAEGKDFFKLPDAENIQDLVADPLNPITQAKIDLGKLLFHETGLSITPKHAFSKGTYSCSTCHFAEAGFQSGRFQAIADGGIGFGNNGEGRERGALYEGEELDAQPVRAPSVMHSGYAKNVMWNGIFGANGLNIGTEAVWDAMGPSGVNHLGFEGVESQAIAALIGHRLAPALPEVLIDLYAPYFASAFPDVAAPELYNNVQMGLALAAYQRSILANEAPFQKWLRGDKNALTAQEKEGAIVFFEKGKCAQCHTGPSLSSTEFYSMGMANLNEYNDDVFQAEANHPGHLGRGDFTKNEADNHKFKVPQLYNLKDSPFYGHGSSFTSIQELVEYLNAAIPGNPNVPTTHLSASFKPLSLTTKEIEALTAFLSEGLYDNNLLRYQPSSVPSGNCFPSNDPLSRYHLGCD